MREVSCLAANTFPRQTTSCRSTFVGATYPVDAHTGPCSSLCTSANPESPWGSQIHAQQQAVTRCILPKGMGVRGQNDAEADMLLAEAASAICVQRFDGSRNSAIHTTYRISLRSSSLREPRYPLLRVVFVSGAIRIAPFDFRFWF